MATVATTIDKVLGYCSGQYRPNFDFLNGAFTAGDPTMTLTNDTWDIAPGDWVEVGTEPFFVTEKVNETLYVQAGLMPGVTAGSHADGATITVRPWFLRSDIRNHLYDVILALPNDVAPIKSESVTFVTNKTYAELTATEDVLTVLYGSVHPSEATGVPVKRIALELIRGSTFVVSGNIVQVAPTPAYFTKEATVDVFYSYRWDTSTWTDATDLDTLDMSAQLQAAVIYGAASRTLQARAAARTQIDAQGASRDTEGVPVGASLQMAQEYERTHLRLLGAERSRRRGLYGVTVV